MCKLTCCSIDTDFYVPQTYPTLLNAATIPVRSQKINLKKKKN